MTGRVRIDLGDCLELMAGMADNSADLVLTDPPYERHMHSAKKNAGGRKIRTDGYAEIPPVEFSPIEPIRADAARHIVRISRGWALVFCTPEGIAPWRDALEAAGAHYKRACFWCKSDSAPQFNGAGPAFAVEAFVAAWCGRGRSRWNGGGRRNWWIGPTGGPLRDGRHPTEKPADFMGELIGLFSNAGDLVFDPFTGSGTTGVAALAMKRRFHGVEIDPQWHVIARERVEGLRPGIDMTAGPLFSFDGAAP